MSEERDRLEGYDRYRRLMKVAEQAMRDEAVRSGIEWSEVNSALEVMRCHLMEQVASGKA